jgi:dTDP-4-amino-4,6-dideoxygalactose transaminase
VRLPELSGGDYRSSFHLYVIEVEHSLRKTVFDHLRRKGIGVNVHYIPIYMQPIYRRHGYSSCPEAEKYYWGALSLPMYPGLRRSEAEFVRDCLREIVG